MFLVGSILLSEEFDSNPFLGFTKGNGFTHLMRIGSVKKRKSVPPGQDLIAKIESTQGNLD